MRDFVHDPLVKEWDISMDIMRQSVSSVGFDSSLTVSAIVKWAGVVFGILVLRSSRWGTLSEQVALF